MSILKDSEFGWLISHQQFINEIYQDIKLSIHPDLFKIIIRYKPKKKRKSNLECLNPTLHNQLETESEFVEGLFTGFLKEMKWASNSINHLNVNNEDALNAANKIYNESGKNLVTDAVGYNSATAKQDVQNTIFVFPSNCNFFCKNVTELTKYLKDNIKYDLILLDPPWWNKYIRRKRKHSTHGYDMMYNDDLKTLPLENYLTDEGVVVVWCTNSKQHLNVLIEEIFPKWNIQFVGKWYWVKVTQHFEPVCDFNKPPGKQPFEQIVIGSKNDKKIPINKIVVSIPSALHSHKPPLIKLLEPFIPDKPLCLEIFARYLLPNWTSFGLETLRLQNICLYRDVNSEPNADISIK